MGVIFIRWSCLLTALSSWIRLRPVGHRERPFHFICFHFVLFSGVFCRQWKLGVVKMKVRLSWLWRAQNCHVVVVYLCCWEYVPCIPGCLHGGGNQITSTMLFFSLRVRTVQRYMVAEIRLRVRCFFRCEHVPVTTCHPSAKMLALIDQLAGLLRRLRTATTRSS